MINQLLLAAGITIAKRRARDAISRFIFLGVAYAVLLFSTLVAAGFLTTAGFIHLSETFSVVEACAIMAAFYALIGTFGFLTLRLIGKRRGAIEPDPLAYVRQPVLAYNQDELVQDQRVPSFLISAGLLLVVGYVAGKSLRFKR